MSSPDRYAVLGHPVAHSQSPFIHGEFARQCRQAMCYERVLCPLDGFAESLQAFAAGGGRGCNVTVPFKLEAWQVADEHTARADRARAANTLRRDGDRWVADNTDGVGLRRDLEVNAGVGLAGRTLLLIGAGGAAAGVLGPLLQAAQGFLDWAASRGAQGRDGLGMLVEQAAEAFLFWRGVRPETAPVLEALRARLAADGH